LNKFTKLFHPFVSKRHRKPQYKLRVVAPDKVAVLRDMLLNGDASVYVTYDVDVDNDGDTRRDTYRATPRYTYKVNSVLDRMMNKFVINTSVSGNRDAREKRLRSGCYTNGRDVYETKYDYVTGKNVMKRKGSLEDYVREGKIGKREMERLEERVKRKGRPDVVRERLY
jgi:hypothetical protein